MRKLLQSEINLLQTCSQYKSLETLKAQAPHNYYRLQKRGLVKYLFPEHTCALPTNYIDPRKMQHYKKNYIEEITNIINKANKALINIEKASTTNEVDKQYKKLKQKLKEEICN